MGFYPEHIIQEVQSAADIIEIVSQYTSLQKRGDNYTGLCPFHTEKTPSFSVDSSKQLFYCFGCGIGGNIFTFVMEKESLSFPEAIRYLADKYGVALPSSKLDKAVSEEFKKRRKLYQTNNLIAKYYNYCLMRTKEGQKAINYLKKRGITLDTIKVFNIGYALPSWDGLLSFAKSKNISLETLKKLGLIVQRRDNKGYYDRFRNRIIFPIYNVTQNVIGFGGRAIDDSHPKYLNSPETELFSKGSNLYALSLAKKASKDDIIIVEGYMDCISLYQYGYRQTVASLGTALSKEQAKLLKKYTNGVILAYDADEAGQRATMRGMDILAKEGLNVRILSLPKGSDPDDYIRSQGKEAFSRKLTKSLNRIDYKLYLAKKDVDISTSQGKLNYIKSAVDILSKIKSEPQLEIYVKKVADELEISEHAVKKEVQKGRLPDNGFGYKKAHTRNNNKGFNKLLQTTGYYKAEVVLLKLLIENEGIRNMIKDEINPDFFVGENTRKIAEIVFHKIDKGLDINATDLFNLLDDESARELSRALMIKIDMEKESLVDPLIKKVKEGYYKHSISVVLEKIKKAELLGNKEEIVDLLSNYQKLKTEMENLNIYFTPGKGGA